MTYRGSPAPRGNQIMTVLVIITIALVAYWAATGGLDQILVAETVDTITESQ